MKIDENLSFLRENKKQLLQNKIEQLIKNIDTLCYIILFGSYVRGEEKSTSDMDILVLTDHTVDREIRGALCSDFEENNMDLIFYTLEQFKASDCLFVQEIQKEGIIIWKRN